MKEEWLHFIWKMKRLPLNLKTKKGESIEIIHPGIHNLDSGPDFFEAKIKINQLIWSGDVEIHIRSSDWLKNKHQLDEAYNNVILHVVFIHDLDIQVNNELLPVLELHSIISLEDIEKISQLSSNMSSIPCAHRWGEVPEIIKSKEIESAFFRRLERKSFIFDKRINELNFDTLKLKFELLGKIILTKVNELPMVELLTRIPTALLLRLNTEERTALLLGVSGLIPKFSEIEEVKSLKKEASFLMNKYQIFPMNKASWKFFGCRPPAYPTIRMVLFSLLMEEDVLFKEFQNKELFLSWIENKSIEFPKYWKNNTHFNPSNSKINNTLSRELKMLIIANFIVPFYYWQFSKINSVEQMEELINLAYNLPPEKNSKIESFKKLGQKIKSIAETQGLLELLNEFCNNKKCLSCQIGNKLLTS